MKNLSIYFPLVDGSLLPYHDPGDEMSGKKLINTMISDDWGVPPRAMVIEVIDEKGRKFSISIPYDESQTVLARVLSPENGAKEIN